MSQTLNHPDLRPVHELAFASPDVLSALEAFAKAMREAGGRLTGLSIGASFAGAQVARARISGLDPDAARALANTLADSANVTSAQVEHVFWKVGS